MCVCHMICVSSRLLASVFDCIYLHRCCCTCATQAIITVISIIICMFQKTLLLKWNHRVTNVTHCLVAKSTGSVLCTIEYFCLTLQMTCSTWIRTFAIVIVSSFPNWLDNCIQLIISFCECEDVEHLHHSYRVCDGKSMVCQHYISRNQIIQYSTLFCKRLVADTPSPWFWNKCHKSLRCNA